MMFGGVETPGWMAKGDAEQISRKAGWLIMMFGVGQQKGGWLKMMLRAG